jgi:hypothetical protein
MQHREGEEFFLQRIDQGLKLHAHLADPLGERRLGDGEPALPQMPSWR